MTMKICQVNPGCGIEIPPKGWGAIEKIVWEFTKNLQKQGHQVDIKWANETQKGEYDLVHVHVANLALILAERGIPYVFQCHDHHAFHYGKDSPVFKQNLEAIEKSEISILPAKYLVDYFGSNKAIYFSHGVDTEFFTPKLQEQPHKLLMVANNGLGGKDGYDRKGFTEGIKAAASKNLPITIAGPKNNKNFIENNPWVKDYNIDWIFNPNQEELLHLYQSHTIFLHPSELEAGHPNLTLLEAMACGLPIVGCMEGDLKGMIRVNKKWEEVAEGVQTLITHYSYYSKKALTTASKLSWYNRSLELLKLITPNNMKDILIKEYTNTRKKFIPFKETQDEFQFSFIKGAKCTIKGNSSKKYKVEFIDSSTNTVIWYDTISCGMWTECNKKYYIPWKIKVTDISSNKEVATYTHTLKGKKVYIHLDSKSLGDTLAWFPYVEEFRTTHECKVACSTFHNDWFQSDYPEIEFVNPGEVVNNIHGHYTIGWFLIPDKTFDSSKHPQHFQKSPLQKTASDILGLQYKEIKPTIKNPSPSPIKEKYVSISIQSTCQAKYWNHPTGWEQVVKFLQNKGYKVAVVDQHRTFGIENYLNTSPECDYHFHNKSLDEVMSVINGAEFHIGISSGLSWIAWALNTPVVLISSFTHPDHCEFKSNCTRIYNDNSLSGYLSNHALDPSNWNWYPLKDIKSMEDWYEAETITPDLVIKNLDRIL